jgi:hypothetical protein
MFIVSNVALCVNDGGGNCDDSSRSAGNIYVETASVMGIDLAEQYPTKDKKPSAGEIAMLDNENPVFVKKFKNDDNAYPIGIISTDPGILLGGFNKSEYEEEELVSIALTGRIPLKVSDENGPIQVGDEITVSEVIPGFGMKADASSDFIVAVALEPLPEDKKTAEIMVFLLLDRRQQAEELCVEDVCVGKDELRALIQMVKD